MLFLLSPELGSRRKQIHDEPHNTKYTAAIPSSQRRKKKLKTERIASMHRKRKIKGTHGKAMSSFQDVRHQSSHT